MYMLFALNHYLTLEEEFSPETSALVTTTADVKAERDGIFSVDLRLKIPSGWHINANPPGQANLIPTTLTVDTDTQVEIVDVAYPKGRSAHFEFSDESVNVYEGNLAIPIKLKLKPNHKKSTQVTLKLTYQPCNETECLLPQTLNIPLDLP